MPKCHTHVCSKEGSGSIPGLFTKLQALRITESSSVEHFSEEPHKFQNKKPNNNQLKINLSPRTVTHSSKKKTITYFFAFAVSFCFVDQLFYMKRKYFFVDFISQLPALKVVHWSLQRVYETIKFILNVGGGGRGVKGGGKDESWGYFCSQMTRRPPGRQNV